MSNRLSNETSPYLLQHKDNPVDWYPWGEEAIEHARQEDKPIFLSIGYSACHWCHVMEHESFENYEIARNLNDRFVSIKVDREDRPDLDQIYMSAVQAITGRGGWPMSVFLNHSLEPFYGGTYWPPKAAMGMPGFDQILEGVIEAWTDRRAEVDQQASSLADFIRQQGRQAETTQPLSSTLLDNAVTALERGFDHVHGGFGTAPKFPHPMDLLLLLRMWRSSQRSGLLEMVQLTLDKMATGGIYDHLGGGFHRYSVDQLWLVPHFEKMLYDNALLASCYLEAFVATGQVNYQRVVTETLDYVLREMQHPQGGFTSTQDADSEGEEGKYFVWSPAEVREVLGEEAAERFCRIYDVTSAGNFEGQNILNLPKAISVWAKILDQEEAELRNALARSRAKLFERRATRVHPGLDDKILTSWNGLMIEAMARAGAVLNLPRYLEAAEAASQFIYDELRTDNGRLLHSWRNGLARLDAYLDDYSAMLNALVTLYECTFNERWLNWSV
ncbi:MAG: thioredoxin domain-containing protein, partial [Planctomycetales bacterium]